MATRLLLFDDMRTRGGYRGRFEPRRCGSDGFSFVELVIGIALLGVLTAIATPQLSSFRASYSLRTGAQQVAFELTRTRMLAVGENNYARVRFGAGGGYGWQKVNTWVVERSTDGTTYTAVGATSQLPRNVYMWVSPGTITFTRQGLSSSSLTVYLFNNLNDWKTIWVNAVGKVNVQ